MANPNYFWSEEEVIILKESYANGGLKTAVERLPNKTRGVIATKACRLEITKAKPRNRGLDFSMTTGASPAEGMKLDGRLSN